MKNKYLFLAGIIILCSSFGTVQSQSVGIGTLTPDNSAILDIKSTTKGLLAPRMSTVQRTAIATPVAGLLVYDTDTNSYWYYNGTIWGNLSITGTGTSNFLSKFSTPNTFGNSQFFDNGTNIGINTVSPAGKLHIKGSADAWQLVIDANATQSNTNPLINLRKSDGSSLMWLNSDHPFNTFVGLYAGSANNAAGGAQFNTFIGRDAGASNTTGSANTANGAQALQLNTTGIGNTASGAGALQNNSIGFGNTAFGTEALQFNTIAIRNTAIGFKALWLNTINFDNTAIGHSALLNNTGFQNTATGSSALKDNTTGSDNTATGAFALQKNINGIQNTAVGSQALYNNTTADNNTAVGYYALQQNTIGTGNTALGYNALLNNDGNANTAIGYKALFTNTFGANNTTVGYLAGEKIFAGFNNIAIGSGSGNAFGNLSNNVGIGNNDYLIGSSNTVILGNASTGFIGGAVGFTNQSDARIKNTILEDVKGLDFILHLRPVTYHVSVKAITALTGNKETPDFPEKYDREKVKYTGFIAQEVEQAAKNVGYDFSGVYIPTKSTELYGLRYSEFVVPLVKAMQEQQAMIDSLKSQLVTVKADNLTQSEKQQIVILQLQQQAVLLEKRLAVVEAKK
jgi:hypothetical protein